MEKKNVIMLFVYNIPKTMHCKGLWALFEYHGKVVDAFILKRESIRGRRYEFVRFNYRRDAQREITRLNDFILMGNRIWVKMARFKASRKIWRNVKEQGGQE